MAKASYPKILFELSTGNEDMSTNDNESEDVSGEDRANVELLEMCYYDEYGEIVCGPVMEHTARPEITDAGENETNETSPSFESVNIPEMESIRRVASQGHLKNKSGEGHFQWCFYDEYGKMTCKSTDIQDAVAKDKNELEALPILDGNKAESMRRAVSQVQMRKLSGAPENGSYFYDSYGELIPKSPVEPASPDERNIHLGGKSYAKVAPIIKSSKMEKIHRAGSHHKLNSLGQQSSPSHTSDMITKHPRREKVIVERGPDGKFGVMVRRLANFLYFAFVEKGSPAAAAGIGFGDQLLELSGLNLSGLSGAQVIQWLKVSKQREFEMTLVKRPYDFDLRGSLGPNGELTYSTKLGKILGSVKLSKVVHKGHIKHLQLLSVNSKPVIFRNEAEISEVFKNVQSTLRLRVMPRLLFDHLLKQLDKTRVRDYIQLSSTKA